MDYVRFFSPEFAELIAGHRQRIAPEFVQVQRRDWIFLRLRGKRGRHEFWRQTATTEAGGSSPPIREGAVQ